MEASPARVIQYFNGEKQNIIPLFQRPYTWTQRNWQTLWDDLMVQHELGDKGTHFMGAIVSVPAKSTPVGVNKYLIIDGQQRLTTVSILLCALRDLVDQKSSARIQEVYLTNRFREPEDTLKLVPTQVDRDTYNSLVIDQTPPDENAESRMSQAYHFFRDRLTNETTEDDKPIQPVSILATLEHSLQVVMINLSEDDDPYLIFESLNFKGTPLSQSDLVRNYLLMRFRHSISAGGEQERVYNKYWVPLEKNLDDSLPEFLRHYIMKDGELVKQGGIYSVIKDRLKQLPSSAQVEAEAKNLCEFGEFYSKFLSPESEYNPTIREHLTSLKELKQTTTYPLLLRLFRARQDKLISDESLAKCLLLVESFVIRRMICGVVTNVLNKLLPRWAQNIDLSDPVNWLHKSMSSGTGGPRFPKDAEFAEAFLNQPQYGRGATAHVLRRLERSYKHKEVVDLSNATIEHVLPQTLTPEWISELGTDALTTHDRLLHTFGNLTLTGYNTELSNYTFTVKKEKLANTHIELNRWIIEQEKWGAEQIQARAKMLLEIANRIWLSPLAPTSE